MLPELVESKAQGEIADIYAQIRSTCAVPYVSSLQRHLATRPGWLEWAWAAVAPVFRSGIGPTAAWEAADALTVPELPPLSRSVLGVWGVDAKALHHIRNICATFVRVSPTNLMFSALVRHQLRVAPSDEPRGKYRTGMRLRPFPVYRPWSTPCLWMRMLKGRSCNLVTKWMANRLYQVFIAC